MGVVFRAVRESDGEVVAIRSFGPARRGRPLRPALRTRGPVGERRRPSAPRLGARQRRDRRLALPRRTLRGGRLARGGARPRSAHRRRRRPPRVGHRVRPGRAASNRPRPSGREAVEHHGGHQRAQPPDGLRRRPGRGRHGVDRRRAGGWHGRLHRAGDRPRGARDTGERCLLIGLRRLRVPSRSAAVCGGSTSTRPASRISRPSPRTCATAAPTSRSRSSGRLRGHWPGPWPLGREPVLPTRDCSAPGSSPLAFVRGR